MNRVDKTEAYLSTLPLIHQNMMLKYRDHLFRIRSCIGKYYSNHCCGIFQFANSPICCCSFLTDENFQIIRKLVEDVGNLFENANQSMVPQSNNHHNDDDDIRVRFQDMDKVNDICVNKIFMMMHFFFVEKKNELPHSVARV